MHAPNPDLLGPEDAAFVCGGVGMSMATCRPGALPNLVRATGCRLAENFRVATVIVAAIPGAAVLDDIRRTGAVAVVFSQPSTHRTVQLKGNDARIVPLEASDLAVVERYVAAFVAELESFGFPQPFTRALLAQPADDLVGVQFTIAAAYSQTPGPQAGRPLVRPA
jgi:hypothetical protein